MKKTVARLKDMYGQPIEIEFIYNNTTTICNIIHNWNDTIFKGVAKLHPDDTYDRIKGEQIAFARACTKFNNTLQAIINNVERIRSETKKLDNVIRCMYAKVQKAQKNFNKKQNKINSTKKEN